MNGTGTSVTGHKKKKRSRRARTLLARSKSYPNLRAAAELGTESLKRRLGFLGSGGSAGSGAGPNGLDLEADLYLDQNKRNRLYILAHKLLTAFPEQKRDLKRIILKLEQSTLNGATSSSSSTKKKGHKRSTSSGGYTSGGYGSGAGIGIGTIPSMASFSNPDYIDYDEPQDPAEFDVQGPAHTPGASIVHVFIDHSNILIGLLNFLRRHPPPQSTVDEYITSRTRLTSHSTPALIDVEVDGEISIPSHNADNPRTRNGSKPIPIPGKGKGKMPVVETPTPSAEEYPIPLPSFATAKSKGTPKRHSNPQASLVALSKSLPSESFLSQGQAGAGDERVLDSNEEGSRSDGRLKKPLPPKFPRHIWHAALVLILERGRPVSRRVVVTSSPLHQPMEKIMSLGYEVRVFIRVPDLGDGMDRREKENRFSNGNNSGSGAGKSNASQTSHSKSGGAFGTSSSPGGKGFVYGAVSAAGNGVGSPSGSLAGTPNAGVGTPAKKGHARHLSGYTSNESGSGSNRDNKGIGGPSPGTPAKVRYREQGVDELLQLKLHQALADVDNVPKGSTIVLATGDGNVGQFNEDGFLGPVRLALRKGWKVELYAWEDGLSKSWRREFGEGISSRLQDGNHHLTFHPTSRMSSAVPSMERSVRMLENDANMFVDMAQHSSSLSCDRIQDGEEESCLCVH
ncbi:hypothetical protein BKA70DRAFT_182901 [Coprinopsis sp. MPI-PUGE-AT-0042]|nr:hypothetical protein BKA70DRAFT_182901 [Coprinopsis sp. MPI-PUGE-AT-0042]